jgi:hypothetical protein
VNGSILYKNISNYNSSVLVVLFSDILATSTSKRQQHPPMDSQMSNSIIRKIYFFLQANLMQYKLGGERTSVKTLALYPDRKEAGLITNTNSLITKRNGLIQNTNNMNIAQQQGFIPAHKNNLNFYPSLIMAFQRVSNCLLLGPGFYPDTKIIATSCSISQVTSRNRQQITSRNR